MGGPATAAPAPAPVRAAPIERASASDRAFLAMDNGHVPEQFGVVLELDGPLSLPRVRDLVADRIQAVPRLRQRLVSVPFGCGGPVWVDDAAFDIRQHVREVDCGAPGDEQALMDTALQLVTSPLRREDAAVVGEPGGRAAGRPDRSRGRPPPRPGGRSRRSHHPGRPRRPGTGGATRLWTPRPRPLRASLLTDALLAKAKAVAGVRGSWRLLSASMGAGGGLRPPRIADCSLMRPTGARRRRHGGAHAVRRRARGRAPAGCDDQRRRPGRRRGCPAEGAREAGRVGRHPRRHRPGVRASYRAAGRPRQPGEPAARRGADHGCDGPATGDRRSDRPCRQGRRRPVPRPSPCSAGCSGRWPRLGGYRWYINHQRRLHTLVSHLRGPVEPISFDGRRIDAAVPIIVGESGNSTVTSRSCRTPGR